MPKIEGESSGLGEQVAAEIPWEIRACQAGTSLRRTRHLLSDKQVDLPTVVFIVGKTLVDLRPFELREAPCRQRVNRFAIL
jgi:hypothetical protein